MHIHPLAQWIETNKTISALAKAARCSPSHIRNIIARRKEPSLPLATRLSEETGLPTNAFLKPEAKEAEKVA